MVAFGAQFTQQHLFDPASTRGRTAGDMSSDEWWEANKDDTVYHGTFRDEWRHAPTAHFGTRDAALQRLSNVEYGLKDSSSFRRKYYDPDSSDFDTDYEDAGEQEHVGRLYGRVIDRSNVHPRKLNDPDANAADMHHWMRQGYESYEIPRSVAESLTVRRGGEEHYVGPSSRGEGRPSRGGMRPPAIAASIALKRGKTLSYDNDVEGGVSYIADPSTTTTWEHEQLRDPNASPARKDFAQQRITSGQAGAQAFERPAAQSQSYWQNSLDGTGRRLYGDPRGVVHERRFRTDF